MRPSRINRALQTLGRYLLVAGSPVYAPGFAGAAAPVNGFQLPPVAGPGNGSAMQDATAVRVERIAFRGNLALRTSALESVAKPYLQRKLLPGDIEELRLALTHQYTDHGYINSGVILDPDAPYRDGVLSFLVIEGRIRQVRVHGQKGLRQSYIMNRLRPDPDETLNVDVLRQRFQRLLDDPLFARVNSRIEPGSQLGEALLDVDVDRARPYSAAIALNNYRPPSIGEKAYDISGQLRDLTGFGDWIDADLTGPLEFTGGLGYSVGWQLPFNHTGSEVALSSSRAETVVTDEALATLDIRSTIERQELKLIQPLWLSQDQQLSLGASIAQEKDSTTLGNVAFSFLPGADEGVTRSITARVNSEYSYRSEQQYFGFRLTLLHAYLLDYSAAPVSYAPPNQQYFVWTGQLHNLWEIPQTPFEFESRAVVQRTNALISDLHAVEIGGIDSVRGFRENELLVANVQNLNLDVRWLATQANGSRRPGFTLGLFFDWAAGYDVGQPTNTFSSCGITSRLKWQHVQADFAFGTRLIHPEFVNQEHGSWQDHGIHAQILATL